MVGEAAKGLGTIEVPRKQECLPVLVGPLKDIGDLETEMPRIKDKSGKGDQSSDLVNRSQEGDMAVRSVRWSPKFRQVAKIGSAP